MENLYLIVAYVLGTRAIGINGDLLWNLLKPDMRNFVAVTKGGILIVGRKTNDSFRKQLPGRHVIVVTNDLEYQPKYEVTNKSKIWKRHSIEDGLALAEILVDDVHEGEQNRKIFIAGGEQIYKQFLESSSFLPYEIIATEVDAPGLDGDAYFPPLPEYQYDEIPSLTQSFEKSEESEYAFKIKILRFSTFSA